MDTWVYDESGRLFARANWEADGCWIEISPQGISQQSCPPNWQTEIVTFGHLTLIPMNARCVDIPHAANNESVLVWKLKPHQKMTYGKAPAAAFYAVSGAAAIAGRPGRSMTGTGLTAAGKDPIIATIAQTMERPALGGVLFHP